MLVFISPVLLVNYIHQINVSYSHVRFWRKNGIQLKCRKIVLNPALLSSIT